MSDEQKTRSESFDWARRYYLAEEDNSRDVVRDAHDKIRAEFEAVMRTASGEEVVTLVERFAEFRRAAEGEVEP